MVSLEDSHSGSSHHFPPHTRNFYSPSSAKIHRQTGRSMRTIRSNIYRRRPLPHLLRRRKIAFCLREPDRFGRRYAPRRARPPAPTAPPASLRLPTRSTSSSPKPSVISPPAAATYRENCNGSQACRGRKMRRPPNYQRLRRNRSHARGFCRGRTSRPRSSRAFRRRIFSRRSRSASTASNRRRLP